MKQILISIKPKWVAKILNGEKTIEIRKTCPSIFKDWECDKENICPVEVYIYCTKEDGLCCIKRISRDRYICGKDFDLKDFPHLSSGYEGKGKVVAKFTLNKVEEIKSDKLDRYYIDSTKDEEQLLIKSCLDASELFYYLNEDKNIGYAWHIDNLEIFDKPKELSEFNKIIARDSLGYLVDKKPLTKAPQDFMYIEVGN